MKNIEVRNLFKSYAEKEAVKDLSFSVKSGEILGLIGPNGAGKSTTIKMILDFLKPDSGEIKVFGEPMDESFKNKIGYLPEERGLYKKLTAIDLILYLASLKGMNKSDAKKRAEELLQETGMLESKKKKNKEMSKGMGQIIQFIVTIIHNPELIILDEPFSGLDPVNTDIIKNIIGRLRDEGKTIILSTHQMNKVEEICDRVLMINGGQAVLYGEVNEIKESFTKNSVQIAADGNLDGIVGVKEQKNNNGLIELVLEPDSSPQTVLDNIRERGIFIKRFEITTPSLHEIFITKAGKS